MAKIALVPKHVTATFSMDEVYDLILTLDSCERELEDIPESIGATRDALVKAYDGDLPGDKYNVEQDDADGGSPTGVGI